MDLQTHRDALAASVLATPGVTGFAYFGSAASAAAHRRDEWSDLDFAVFHADGADRVGRDWPFLPFREHLVLTARESHGGGVALYDDGILYEFGAGRPWQLRDPSCEVLLDGGEFDYLPPDQPPDAIAQIRLFLVKLYIGMGRVRRGERLAGGVQIRYHAVTCLAETLRQRLAPDAERNPFDPLRRLEGALPEPAGRLADLLDCELETCARGLFDLARDTLEPGWPEFPGRAADTIAGRLGWSPPA
ncbi:MAG: hypothetical protein AAGC63_08975 [Propionicimonas sp.]|nr:hypothetical protein [Propionicimonas sp.]